ncbi:MAG: hypothetical protein IKX00_00165 [Bacilli bacterium]|nr:hypothetical protein [Bacilli bacterium]
MNERVEFDKNPCIQRIEEKCTRCGLCKKTCEKVNNIGNDCIKCGQCILTCPMGALVPKYDYQQILNYLNDTNYTVIISMAPAARVSLINELKLNPNNATKELVGILRKVGFDYVYDVAVGADLTTIEESLEFIERIKENNFPLITSCCPSWKKYAIKHDLDKYVSSTKSPIKMQGYIVKEYTSKFINYSNKVINVMLMPCISKKEEILDTDDIDFVITTRELIYLVNESNIDLETVIPSDFDKLAGNASSSGIIFGTSGGVLEAVLRSAYYFINNEDMPKNLLNKNLDNNSLFMENTYDFKKFKINVAKVSTMAELQKIDIHKYHLIEVMACPGGCINGGGQPLNANNENDEKRLEKSKLLQDIDINSSYNNSYSSSEVKDIYSYGIGIPGGKNSHKKLHDE